MDKLVAQRFKFLYPKADIVSNVIIDGFRLDLSFPAIKLNVELDGPSHRSLATPATTTYHIPHDIHSSFFSLCCVTHLSTHILSLLPP